MFPFLTLFWSRDSCHWSMNKEYHFPNGGFVRQAFYIVSGFCWRTLYVVDITMMPKRPPGVKLPFFVSFFRTDCKVTKLFLGKGNYSYYYIDAALQLGLFTKVYCVKKCISKWKFIVMKVNRFMAYAVKNKLWNTDFCLPSFAPTKNIFVYLLVTFHAFQIHVHFHYCTLKRAKILEFQHFCAPAFFSSVHKSWNFNSTFSTFVSCRKNTQQKSRTPKITSTKTWKKIQNSFPYANIQNRPDVHK